MMERYLFGAAAICFLADAIVTLSIFFMMMGEIIPFGPPPYWLSYGMLAAIWFAALGLVSFVGRKLFGVHR